MKKDHVFHRNFNKQYPLIEQAEGIYLTDNQGKTYIDGSSGAVAVNVGHKNKHIINRINEQAEAVSYVHTMRFETRIQHDLSALIAEVAGPELNWVYYTSGGAEANESAFKLARQYHVGRGDHKRSSILSHWNSYHGNTLWTLSAGGDVKRRKLYQQELIQQMVHATLPYQTKDPDWQDANSEDYVAHLLSKLENTIKEKGPETISAFILEPIIGSQVAALSLPDNYLKGVREICSRYGILMITDEIMTGFGRTGKWFAFHYSGITPDIVTFAKGVSSAYMPLGGMIVTDELVNHLNEQWNGTFSHGYTFSGHPLSLSAGMGNLEYVRNHHLITNAVQSGGELKEKINQLSMKYPFIRNVRGRGLLIGIELTRLDGTPLPPELLAAETFNTLCTEEGLMLYPGQGKYGEIPFDHLIISPPFIITSAQIDELIRKLSAASERFLITLSQSGNHVNKKGDEVK